MFHGILSVNALTPDPQAVIPAAPEAPLSCTFVHVMSWMLLMLSKVSSTTPKRQTPEPPLTNEELRAMLDEFKPIGSYDESESQCPIVVY